MNEIVLTEEQEEAITWIVEALLKDTRVVALRGLAGTGKTSIIPALRERLEVVGIGTALGASTHRAKMVLRKKGLDDAQTYHKHAMTMHFRGDYAVAAEWLGESVPCFAVDHATARPPVEGVPALIAERLAQLAASERPTPAALKAAFPRHRATDILSSIGIEGTDYVAGWGPKDGVDCLIIDEASMLNTADLETCSEAFPLVVLVGDPGQLPPVSGTPALQDVPGVELTTIQRQAADSPIIQLAYSARAGREFYRNYPVTRDAIECWDTVCAQAFLSAPLIVGTNTRREKCTRLIRQALGYTDYRPVPDEPIVCRQTRGKDGIFYNNALFRVVEVNPANPREVVLREEDGEKTHEVTIHLEEFDGPNVALGAIRCRFGYVYTAHTAQGGEWPTVYVSDPGIREWRTVCRRHPETQDFAKWSYTALTRARQMVVFVKNDTDFAATVRPSIPTWKDLSMPRIQRTDTEPVIAPPSAPFLTAAVPEDIPDPVVPAGTLAEERVASATPALPEDTPTMVAESPAPGGLLAPALHPAHEPLLRGFVQYMHAQLQTLLMDESLRVAKQADITMQSMHDYVKQVLQTMAYSQADLPKTLESWATEGLKLVQPPYQVKITATAPGGYPVEFTLTKQTPEEMVAAATGLTQWLTERGYGPAGAEVAA